MLVMPDEGEVLALSYLVNKSSPTNLKLHLFKNDVTPTDSTVLADLTECDFTGYSAVTLTGASWTVSTSSGITTASYAQQSFVMTSGGNLYGYYITDNSVTKIIWVERFDGAPAIISGSGTIYITPKIVAD